MDIYKNKFSFFKKSKTKCDDNCSREELMDIKEVTINFEIFEKILIDSNID